MKTSKLVKFEYLCNEIITLNEVDYEIQEKECAGEGYKTSTPRCKAI